MIKLLIILSSVLIFLSCANNSEQQEKDSSIKSMEVEYNSDGTTLKGFLAYDENVDGKRPGVLVVHEWWGHNEYARKRAVMLAELGYIALAVDMYGDGKQANHPEDAQRFAMELFNNMEEAKNRFAAAYDFLTGQPQTDQENMGAIGYCFGGGVALQMARFGFDLKGVASFHGAIQTQNPAKPNVVKAELLVCNGADDKMVTTEQIDNFKKEMDAAGVIFTFINYPGAVHSFTNPIADSVGKKFDMPLAYNENADRESWKELQKFFNRIFE